MARQAAVSERANIAHSILLLPAWLNLSSSIQLPFKQFHNHCPPLQHPINFLNLWIPLLGCWHLPRHQEGFQLSPSLPSPWPSLLPKLPPILLNWLHSYVLNCSQAVSSSKWHLFSPQNCFLRCPSGLNLGTPPLYSIHQWCSNLLCSLNSCPILHADDLFLYKPMHRLFPKLLSTPNQLKLLLYLWLAFF